VQIDAAANAANAERIGAPGSRVSVLVIPTNEELMIARHTRQLVGD
jgi:acetate kinase